MGLLLLMKLGLAVSSGQFSVVSGQKVKRCNNLMANIILSAVEGLEHARSSTERAGEAGTDQQI